MLDQRIGRNPTWLKAGSIVVVLVIASGMSYVAGGATAFDGDIVPDVNRVGDSSFIDTQQEYASGVSSSQLGLWYTWIDAGGTEVVFLALDFEGLQFMGSQLRSPVSMVVGQHFNTSEGEVFVANSPRYMEIYNDTNGNGVPDANFTAGNSEIQYYVLMNSSKSFQPILVEKQVDGNGIPHYTWGVRYNEIDAILQYPFIETYPPQHPTILVFIEYIRCSYDYHISGNLTCLKIDFEVGPLRNPRTLDSNFQEVPADLNFSGTSLSILFSTLIVTAKPNYQVTLGGGAYNSTTAKTPVTPTNEAKLDLQESTVYSFLFGENYTLTTNSVSHTYPSKAAACSNASVSSPWLGGGSGALLFSRWGSEAKVIEDLIPRISSTLNVGAILDQTSSFFYRVSYPKWGNGTIIHDPTYVANLGSSDPSNPSSNGLGVVQIVTITATAGMGIAMLAVALSRRKKKPTSTDNERS
nr:hypothetical protein [Candidatus Njordarchaeota archaeon]